MISSVIKKLHVNLRGTAEALVNLKGAESAALGNKQVTGVRRPS